jgi:hypothetical protein
MSAEISTEQLLVLVKELKGKEETRSKWYVGPLVTVIIAVVSVFVSWGMMMKTTEFLQDQVEKLQTQVQNDNLEIVQLKINQRVNDTVLVQIKDDVKEVKDNVNRLVSWKTQSKGDRK